MTSGGRRGPTRALWWLARKAGTARSRVDWITVCVLTPACVFALLVGIHDALVADDLGIRTIGAGLAALGLVIGYAVVMRLDHGSKAEAIEMLACLVVTAISCYLFAAQVLGRHIGLVWPLFQLAILAAFAVGSVVGARVLRRQLSDRGEKVALSEFKLLGSAVSLGALIGVLQFWYTNIYLPGSAEPSVTITPSIDSASLRSTPAGPRLLLSARIDLNNTSGSRLEVVGAEYFFYGTCVYAQSHHSSTEQVTKAMSGGAPATLQAEQYRELVGFGKLPLEGQLIDTGETDHQFVIGILKPRYFDMASIATYVVLARPTLHLGTPTKFKAQARPIATTAASQGPPCDHLKPDSPTNLAGAAVSITYASAIDDHSWLHWLARGRQYLRIHYSTNSTHPVVIGVSPHRGRDGSAGYSDAMSRLYGVTYDVARAGIILPAAGAQVLPRVGGGRRAGRRSRPHRA